MRKRNTDNEVRVYDDSPRQIVNSCSIHVDAIPSTVKVRAKPSVVVRELNGKEQKMIDDFLKSKNEK